MRAKVAAGATVVLLGGLTGLALNDHGKDATKAVADKPLVRTKVIRRTIHVTKHAKPKHPVAAGGAGAAAGAYGSSAAGSYGSATTGASSSGSGSSSSYSSAPVTTGSSGSASAPVTTSTSGASAGGGESSAPVTTATSGGGGAVGGGEVEHESEGGGDD